MKYKYITIEKTDEKISNKFNYKIFHNRTKKILGWIDYDPIWNYYVFEAIEGTIWDIICLQNIIDFINSINKGAK